MMRSVCSGREESHRRDRPLCSGLLAARDQVDRGRGVGSTGNRVTAFWWTPRLADKRIGKGGRGSRGWSAAFAVSRRKWRRPPSSRSVGGERRRGRARSALPCPRVASSSHRRFGSPIPGALFSIRDRTDQGARFSELMTTRTSASLAARSGPRRQAVRTVPAVAEYTCASPPIARHEASGLSTVIRGGMPSKTPRSSG